MHARGDGQDARDGQVGFRARRLCGEIFPATPLFANFTRVVYVRIHELSTTPTPSTQNTANTGKTPRRTHRQVENTLEYIPSKGNVRTALTARAKAILPTKNQLTREPPGTNQPTREPPGTNQPTREPPGTNQPTRQPPGTNQPTRQPPGTNQPTRELPCTATG